MSLGPDVAPTILSLFSGVGGLDLGVEIATGGRVLGYVERDAYAASVLLARMEDKALDPAPVFIGDIQDLDGREFRGRVDIITGGFPCQDLSVAGKQAGLEDGDRSSLWSEMLRIANECGARYIFAENVPAIRSADGRDIQDGPDHAFRERALGSVLRDLAESGWNAEWLCLRASDVGAPHRRERWFMLAHRDGSAQPEEREGDDCEHGQRPKDRGREQQSPGPRTGGGDPRRDHAGGDGGDRSPAVDQESDSGDVADSEDDHRRRRECGEETGTWTDGERGRGSAGGGVFPPGPAGDWSGIPDWLHPAIEPGLRVSIDGTSLVVDQSRADQLRCCGNGVVPLQASVAFVELFRRVNEEEKNEIQSDRDRPSQNQSCNAQRNSQKAREG